MLITKTLEVRAYTQSVYLESKGYVIKKHKVGSHEKLMVPRNLFIEIKVEDLKPSSNYTIEYQCDNCKKDFKTQWIHYLTNNKTKGDLCRKCALKLLNSGESNNNYGKKLSCGFKPGKDNYAAIHFKGSNNPKYNPNLTDEERLNKRDTLENINWRKSVYERDNYKCTICGKSHKLEAHHLNSYTNFKEERFNIENGITLCKYHHKDYHLKYGYMNTTKDKFDNYLKNIK